VSQSNGRSVACVVGFTKVLLVCGATSSRDGHPAVDRQDLARDHAGFVTSEIKRCACDVVGLDQGSTFSDWCAEQTNFPSEVREMALAHAVGDKVEAAYRRGDLFQKRRELAEAWARYCAGEEPAESKVVRLAGRAG